MKYLNGTSNYLKDGFAVPGFAEYAKQRLAKLTQSIDAPCYAVEEEQAWLDRLHEQIEADPYQWFEKRTDLVAELVEKRQAQSLTRLSDPLLHECVQDSCEALKIQSFSAFTFAQDKALRYTAKAVEHMDTMWIFISEHCRKDGILSDLELCFIIGCALGRAQTCYDEVNKTQKLSPEQSRAQFLTKDRAGFLAVLWRAARMYPSLTADELVHKASDVSAQALHKLIILYDLKKKQEITRDELEQRMKKHPLPESHASKEDILPTVWDQIEALRQFAVSIPFVRCASTLWGETHRIVQSYSGAGLPEKNISSIMLG